MSSKKNQSIYGFLSYKGFIKHMIELHNGIHGYQSRLAQEAGCNPSYFSQMLRSGVQLSIEHGYNLAMYWMLNEFETSYFIDLLNYERAGSEKLKKFFMTRLKDAQDKHKDLSNKFKNQESKSIEEQIIYHGHWLMSAVYVLCMIPKERTASIIARKLGITEKEALHYLFQLEKIGFVIKSKDEFISGSINIHLGKTSPFLPLFHRNWRERAVDDSLKKNPASIHYTSLYILSKEAYEKLSIKISDFIEETRNLATGSSAEEVICFNLDYFKITQ